MDFLSPHNFVLSKACRESAQSDSISHKTIHLSRWMLCAFHCGSKLQFAHKQTSPPIASTKSASKSDRASLVSHHHEATYTLRKLIAAATNAFV